MRLALEIAWKRWTNVLVTARLYIFLNPHKIQFATCLISHWSNLRVHRPSNSNCMLDCILSASRLLPLFLEKCLWWLSEYLCVPTRVSLYYNFHCRFGCRSNVYRTVIFLKTFWNRCILAGLWYNINPLFWKLMSYITFYWGSFNCSWFYHEVMNPCRQFSAQYFKKNLYLYFIIF